MSEFWLYKDSSFGSRLHDSTIDHNWNYEPEKESKRNLVRKKVQDYDVKNASSFLLINPYLTANSSYDFQVF